MLGVLTLLALVIAAPEPQGYGGTRQIDDLVRRLPGFALAATERPPSEHGYHRHGVYLLYRTAAVRPVGAGGVWTTGTTAGVEHYAAWQEFGAPGSRVLVVAPHLPAGGGRAADATRWRETRTMLRLGTARARRSGVPVVYAGDVNSNESRTTHVFDGPGLAMRAAGVADAQYVAQRRYGLRYNSANQYRRVPPAFGDSIDRVFASPGVAVESVAVVVRLRAGRFVGMIPSDHNPVVAQLRLRR
ncbi:hypothetical protein GCM10027265_19420 [Jatrophihabitans fulvus]